MQTQREKTLNSPRYLSTPEILAVLLIKNNWRNTWHLQPASSPPTALLPKLFDWLLAEHQPPRLFLQTPFFATRFHRHKCQVTPHPTLVRWFAGGALCPIWEHRNMVRGNDDTNDLPTAPLHRHINQLPELGAKHQRQGF